VAFTEAATRLTDRRDLSRGDAAGRTRRFDDISFSAARQRVRAVCAVQVARRCSSLVRVWRALSSSAGLSPWAM
jgi:hypothetical protein